MRILTRYILKEVFSHSLLGLLVFTFVIFVRHVGHLLELVVRHSMQTRSILELFLLPIPGILVLTIPMAVLVGTLIGLSRMSADGEVIAVRASGIGLGQFVRPVMVIALAGWAIAMWMSLFLAPQSLRKLHRMEQEISTSEAPYEIQPRVFLEQFPNLDQSDGFHIPPVMDCSGMIWVVRLKESKSWVFYSATEYGNCHV